MKRKRIIVAGCGNMGGAILSSLNKSGEYEIEGVEKRSDIRDNFSGEKIKMSGSLSSVSFADILIAAVKPKDMLLFIREINESGFQTELFVSVAAGLKIEQIKGELKKNVPICRVMPNTPLLVGEGLSCIAFPGADEKSFYTVDRIFSLTGQTLRVNEEDMDAVTALSGSGPAYFFLIGEIMKEFAEQRGFSSSDASLLAAATVRGAGALMMRQGVDFTALRKAVTSPEGTTEAAVSLLEKNGLRKIFLEALEAAEKRSAELSGD